ncbi:MAG: N-acetylmuramoyl-L-alanine amidase, partial [Bryobacteraceae bacterium]
KPEARRTPSMVASSTASYRENPAPFRTPTPPSIPATALPPAPRPSESRPVAMQPPPALAASRPVESAALNFQPRHAAPPGAVSPTPAARTAVVTLDKPAIKPESKPQPEVALAATLDSLGDRSLIRVLGLKLDRVAIDPGHGGHDTGTIGPTGLLEKDLVLDVAQRLGALITQRLGSEVVYTRTDDTFVPLQERTRIANEKKAGLFLSIHANSSRLPAIAGTEAYYLNFTTSPSALEVAARENSTSETSIYDLQTLVQKIALKEKVQESREFASTIQGALYTGVTRNKSVKNRGVKKAPFVVLIGANMPSVLAEIAFLSNPKEEKLLKRPEYRQRIAESLFKGVSQYANALSHFQVAQHQPQPDAVPPASATDSAPSDR